MSDRGSIGHADANVFIHALTRDSKSAECRAFLKLLETGDLTCRVPVYIFHEISWAIRKYRKELTRGEIADLLLTIAALPGVLCDFAVLSSALMLWKKKPALSFADALLSVESMLHGGPIYTMNRKHFTGIEADVPDPLPGTPAS